MAKTVSLKQVLPDACQFIVYVKFGRNVYVYYILCYQNFNVYGVGKTLTTFYNTVGLLSKSKTMYLLFTLNILSTCQD